MPVSLSCLVLFLLTAGKERVVRFVNTAIVIANVAGDAIKCGQRFRGDNLVRIGLGFFPKRRNHRRNMRFCGVEPGTPIARSGQAAASQIRSFQRADQRSRRDAGK